VASSPAAATALQKAPPAVDPTALRAELAQAESELAVLQGETPMIRVAVDAQIIGEVISAWTGIPVGKMMKDEISTVLSLPAFLGQRVIGQMHALEIIASASPPRALVSTTPKSPSAIFMLVGPKRGREDRNRACPL